MEHAEVNHFVESKLRVVAAPFNLHDITTLRHRVEVAVRVNPQFVWPVPSSGHQLNSILLAFYNQGTSVKITFL